MRVVALYDIHGNLPALEAVLADAGAPDAWVVGGDVCGGPLVAKTIDVLLTLREPVHWVMGNADREALDEGVLSDGHAQLVRSFAPVVELDGVLYCHGTPDSDEGIITRLTPPERIEALLAGVEAKLVVGGHIHQQHRSGRYVNAGSVGLPYEGRSGAFWLEVDGGEPRFRETAYDVTRVPEWDLARESLIEPTDPGAVARHFEAMV